MGLFDKLFGEKKTMKNDIDFLVSELHRAIGEISDGSGLAMVYVPVLQLRHAAETLGFKFYPVPEGPMSQGDSFAIRTADGLDIVFFDVAGAHTQVMPI